MSMSRVVLPAFRIAAAAGVALLGHASPLAAAGGLWPKPISTAPPHFFPPPQADLILLPPIAGRVACDNYHRVYTANCESAFMELTDRGGACAYTPAPEYDFASTDRFLYIVAWSDASVAQGLLHDLTYNGAPIYSGDPRWQVFATGITKSSCANAPTPAEIRQQILGANQFDQWTAPALGPTNTPGNGTIWGAQSAIAASARWMWFDSGLDTGGTNPPFEDGYDHGEFLIFRMQLAPTVSIRGDVASDNYHAVFTSDREEPGLAVTAYGSGCTWYPATTYNFTTADRYLYIAAWSDHGTAQGLLHDLRAGNRTIWSGDPGWRVVATGVTLFNCNPPSTAQVGAAILAANGGWAIPAVGFANNSTTPCKFWGQVPNIDPWALWTWWQPANPTICEPWNPGKDYGEFLLFRYDLGLCAPPPFATGSTLALTAEPAAASATAGMTQEFHLDAGESRAGELYFLLGSASGIDPGIDLGTVVLPLNPDDYFLATLQLGGTPPFLGFQGVLDSAGTARAVLRLPPGLPALAGKTLHHAFAVPADDAILASNAVRLELGP